MANKAELALILSLVDNVSNTAKSVKGHLGAMGTAGAGLEKGFAGIGARIGASFAVVQAGIKLVANTLRDLKGLVDESITEAANQADAVEKVAVLYGEQADEILKWGKESARTLGMSATEALDAMRPFGNLFNTLGIGNKEAAGMSETLVQLAVDLASFNNLETSDVLERLQKGLSGQGRSLKELGILIDETTLKQEAMTLGLYSGKGALDDASKAQAAYSLMLKQSTKAQGDFAESGDELEVQNKVIKAQLTNLKGVLGTAFLPVLVRVKTAVADFLTRILPKAEGIATKVGTWLGTAFDKVWGAAKRVIDIAKGIQFALPAAVEAIKELLESGKAGDTAPLINLMANMGMNVENARLWGERIAALAQGFGQLFQGIKPEAWEKIGIPAEIIERVRGFADLLGSLGGIFKTGLQALQGRDVWEDIPGGWDPAENLFKPSTPGLKTQLMGLGQQFLDFVVQGMQLSVTALANLAQMFNNWANSQTVLDAAHKFGLGLGTEIASFIRDALNSGENTEKMGNGILTGLTTAVGLIADGLVTIGGAIAGSLVEGLLQSFAPKAAEGLSTMIGYITRNLAEAIAGTYPGGVIGLVSDAVTQTHMPGYASGFEGLVTRPTKFLAGEAGPEYVSVTPAIERPRGGATITIGAIYITSTDPKKAADEVRMRLMAVGMGAAG